MLEKSGLEVVVEHTCVAFVSKVTLCMHIEVSVRVRQEEAKQKRVRVDGEAASARGWSLT